MNKRFISFAFLLVSLAVLPGCWKRKKSSESCIEKDVVSSESNQWTAVDGNEEAYTNSFDEKNNVARKSIFDEDEEDALVEYETLMHGSQSSENAGINPLAATSAIQKNNDYEVSSERKLGTVYFDFDKYSIRNNQKSNARSLAMALENELEANKNLRIVVKGHACDSAGSYRHNLQLSDHRAQTFKSYLIQYGIPAKNIEAFGCGTEELIVLHGNQKEQAPNRRVEVFIARS